MGAHVCHTLTLSLPCSLRCRCAGVVSGSILGDRREMLLASNADRLEALGETDSMDVMRASMSVAQRARHFTFYVLRSRKKVCCARRRVTISDETHGLN